MKSLVGMLLPPSAVVQVDGALIRAEYRFLPVQRVLPLMRDHDVNLKPAGVVRYIEQGSDGQTYVAALVDDRFELDDHRRYLSLKIDAKSRGETLPGRRVRFLDAGLVEISLVEYPRSGSNLPVQLTPLDFTQTRGGFSYDLSTAHRGVLERANHWHGVHHRHGDHILLADPLNVYSVPSRRRRKSADEMVADAKRHRAEAAGGKVPVPAGSRHMR